MIGRGSRAPRGTETTPTLSSPSRSSISSGNPPSGARSPASAVAPASGASCVLASLASLAGLTAGGRSGQSPCGVALSTPVGGAHAPAKSTSAMATRRSIGSAVHTSYCALADLCLDPGVGEAANCVRGAGATSQRTTLQNARPPALRRVKAAEHRVVATVRTIAVVDTRIAGGVARVLAHAFVRARAVARRAILTGTIGVHATDPAQANVVAEGLIAASADRSAAAIAVHEALVVRALSWSRNRDHAATILSLRAVGVGTARWASQAGSGRIAGRSIHRTCAGRGPMGEGDRRRGDDRLPVRRGFGNPTVRG